MEKKNYKQKQDNKNWYISTHLVETLAHTFPEIHKYEYEHKQKHTHTHKEKCNDTLTYQRMQPMRKIYKGENGFLQLPLGD